MKPPLILASASPRRRDLLRAAGIDFEVQPSAIPEERFPEESGETFALRMARDKALQVAKSVEPGRLVLGTDTVVLVETQVLEKPANVADAARMLRLLSGRTHRVVTAICLAGAPSHIKALSAATTRVTFRELDEEEVLEYVASGEPFDKAGAYAIQGLASRFVTRIEGDYTNVVGLPVPLLYALLKERR
jgi:septum formation protein